MEVVAKDRTLMADLLSKDRGGQEMEQCYGCIVREVDNPWLEIVENMVFIKRVVLRTLPDTNRLVLTIGIFTGSD